VEAEDGAWATGCSEANFLTGSTSRTLGAGWGDGEATRSICICILALPDPEDKTPSGRPCTCNCEPGGATLTETRLAGALGCPEEDLTAIFLLAEVAGIRRVAIGDGDATRLSGDLAGPVGLPRGTCTGSEAGPGGLTVLIKLQGGPCALLWPARLEEYHEDVVGATTCAHELKALLLPK